MTQSIHRLIINSKQRKSGTSSDFYIDIKPSLERVNRVCLIHAQIPNTYYNITNAQFIYYDGSTTQIVNIPDGAYDVDSLRLFIDTIPGVNIVTYDFKTFRYTIKTPANHQILGSQMGEFGEKIGFTVDTPPGNTHVGDKAISIGGHQYYCIIIDEFPAVCKSSDGSLFTSFIIPETNNSSQIEFFSHLDKFNQIILYNEQNINQLHIQLRNELNELIDLNGEWSMILEFHYS